MSLRGDERGFTLLETLTAIIILIILGILLYGILYNCTNIAVYNMEKLRTQQDHRVIIDFMAPYIRMAKVVSINENGDKLRLSFNTIAADPDYSGIAFGLKDDGVLYYRKYREVSPGSFEWGNRMSFVSSRVKKFEVIERDRLLILMFEIEEKEGQHYRFEERIYRRVENNSRGDKHE